MAKNKKKERIKWEYLIAVLVLVAGIGGAIIYSGKQTATGGVGTRPVSRMDLQLDFNAWDSSAQDSDNDGEWHIFELENSDLSTLKDEHYANCDDAFNSPLVLDPTRTITQIERGMQYISDAEPYEPYFCKQPNWRKLFNKSGIEDNMVSDGLQRTAADLDFVDSSAGGTELVSLTPGKYLIVFREITTGEVGDVVGGFLVVEVPSSVEATKIDQDALSDVNTGTTDFTIEYNYLSDAFSESKYTVFGSSVDDSTDTTQTLDSSLNGFGDSSLTTATTIDIVVEYGVRIDKDGYAILLDNPMGDGNSEKSYVVYTPDGENATSGTWVEYNTGDFTGDVAYSTADVNTKQLIFQAETRGSCSHTLVSSSSSDAVQDGDEKLYDCFDGMNVKNKGAEVKLDLFVDGVKFDYDASATANNEQVDGASGSSGEDLFDIDWVGVVDGTDRLAQTLSP